MRLILLAAILLLATACVRNRDNTRPDLPPADPVKPEIVIVERKVYVPIRPELTRQRPIAEGSIAQCFDVAAARKAELVIANSKLAEIAAIEGTEVEP